jgi:hypothetical protein
MKVLDLQCGQQHVFEGWFASEDDFLDQCARGLVACPMCGDVSIAKRLSAPRLNLGSSASALEPSSELVSGAGMEPALQATWMALVRKILANTVDVGYQFAEEARKIHYGETKERGIRGKASRAQTESLLEEGIAVLPLLLPEAFKETLQ